MRINPKELIAAANQINDNLKQSEKLPLPLLSVRAKKAALANPEDQSLRLISNVLSKMAENGKIFITRKEFNQVFTKFASYNDCAANYFNDELDKPAELPQRKLAGESIVDDYKGLYSEADASLSNALTSLWDERGNPQAGEYKYYDPSMAKQATTVTNLELSRIGVNPKAVETFAGTKSFIVCNAKYETPNGEASILVPVELSKSGALIPTVFVSKDGFANLDKNTVTEHIKAYAGRRFTVDSGALLNALSNMQKVSTMDDFEIKVLAMQEAINSKKIKKEASVEGTMHFASNGIFMQEVDSNDGHMLEMPKAEGVEKFASSLTSNRGVAEFIFGKDIVETGRKAIASKLASFNYNSQVSVASCDDNDPSITYAVKLNTKNGPVGFEAMAEVRNGMVIMPSIVAIADKAYDFTKSGIDKIANANDTDYKAIAVVSPMYELKPSEILENIRKAADLGDYKTAEEAFTVLAEKADRETYQAAMTEYMRSVNASSNNKLQKTASAKSSCKMIVQASTHSCPLCGHLNLPLDKVYQNEKGECVPLYRKAMDDTYENVLLNTSKIFG